MGRASRCIAIALAGWLVLGAPSRWRARLDAAEASGISESWATERVELHNGRCYEGLIESDDDDWLQLSQLHRPTGRPMHLVIRTFDRASVAATVRLEPDQREKLRQKIDQFRNRARIEAGRMGAVRLRPASAEDNDYLRYRGRWFTLDSTADELTIRRIVVRIEQIFTAYRQVLPPRTDSDRPLRLVVLDSTEGYSAFLARRGLKISNPACFIPADNLVVAGSQLRQYAAEMDKIKVRHDRLRSELERLEKDLKARLEKIGRQLKHEGAPRSTVAKLLTKERRLFADQIKQKRVELTRCDRINARAFEEVTGQMFLRLYHEAFHAFLENYVYPSRNHDVPAWLNEGLATVFEGGLLDSDTLRVDAPYRSALQQLKADLGGERPMSLEAVLSVDQKAFTHGEASRRHYLYCWGLAYYLTFEQGLLNSPGLERYVQPSEQSAAPVERFQALIDTPFAAFERSWRQYILQLR